MECAVVDLFCGIGGLTHGLQLAGLKVCAGFDIDLSCRYAYEANNNSRFIHADIAKVSGEDIAKIFPPNAINILVGCAPCQPFSKYTQRYRKLGLKGNKWHLLESFARLVAETKPEIVSMENVPELCTQDVFAEFVNALTNIGYHVYWKIVFCPDYGVPQKRKRLVLLASLFGDIQLIEAQYSPSDYLTVKNAIGHLNVIEGGQADPNDPLHFSARLSEKNLARIKNSVPGGTWRDWSGELQLDCHKKSTGKTYPAVYGRMSWDDVAPTITTQFYGYGNGRFGHPEQNRALSVREGAVLQSFPIDYKFVEENGKVVKQTLGIHIGNAVPVNLGRAIGLSIINHLGRNT